jgi:hypothetical protein
MSCASNFPVKILRKIKREVAYELAQSKKNITIGSIFFFSYLAKIVRPIVLVFISFFQLS